MKKLAVWAWVSENEHGTTEICRRDGEPLIAFRKEQLDRPGIERELQWHASQHGLIVRLIQLVLRDTLRTLAPRRLAMVPRPRAARMPLDHRRAARTLAISRLTDIDITTGVKPITAISFHSSDDQAKRRIREWIMQCKTGTGDGH